MMRASARSAGPTSKRTVHGPGGTPLSLNVPLLSVFDSMRPSGSDDPERRAGDGLRLEARCIAAVARELPGHHAAGRRQVRQRVVLLQPVAALAQTRRVAVGAPARMNHVTVAGIHVERTARRGAPRHGHGHLVPRLRRPLVGPDDAHPRSLRPGGAFGHVDHVGDEHGIRGREQLAGRTLDARASVRQPGESQNQDAGSRQQEAEHRTPRPSERWRPAVLARGAPIALLGHLR